MNRDYIMRISSLCMILRLRVCARYKHMVFRIVRRRFGWAAQTTVSLWRETGCCGAAHALPHRRIGGDVTSRSQNRRA